MKPANALHAYIDHLRRSKDQGGKIKITTGSPGENTNINTINNIFFYEGNITINGINLLVGKNTISLETIKLPNSVINSAKNRRLTDIIAFLETGEKTIDQRIKNIKITNVIHKDDNVFYGIIDGE